MTPDTAIEFVKIFGLPITILIIIIWAFFTDKVITIGTHDRIIAIMNDRLKDAKDSEAEAWGYVKPAIHLTNAALDKTEVVRKR